MEIIDHITEATPVLERLFLPFGKLVPSSLFLVLESGQGQSRVSGSNLIPEKDIDNMFR